MLHRHLIYTKFSPWKFELKSASGSIIIDHENKRYIDFTSAWNVTNLGWNRPEIIEAVRKQFDKGVNSSMWTPVKIQEKYAAALTRALPKGLDFISKVTGGAEANEHAIKVARAFTGRQKILGLYESYHGNNRSLLSLGYREGWLDAISGKEQETVNLEFPGTYRTEATDTEILHDFEKQLEEVLGYQDIAAIMVEAGIITGWGSVRVAPIGFLKTIRNVTQKYGTLLILDEVGTGFSRLGKLFGMEMEEVTPDIVTFAKGISNGVSPIGVMATTEEIAEKSEPANLQSTFGGLPIACAAALKTLELHQKEETWKQAEETGRYLKKQLQEKLLDHPYVGDIRGIGMEIGIDFVKDKTTKEKNTEFMMQAYDKMFHNGLHVVTDYESVIPVMPPLTIEKELLDEGIDILVESVKEIEI